MQVNNAGTCIGKPTLEYTAEEYSFLMATNLESAYNLCQLSHPLLKASGAGSIVFISSVSGVVAEASSSIYGMTKGKPLLLTEYIITLCSISQYDAVDEHGGGDEQHDGRMCGSIIIFPSSVLANRLAIIIAL
jgi:hypothetical protein